VHLGAQPAHLGAFGVGGKFFRGVVERFDLLGHGEVLVGDGAVGDALWQRQILQLSEYLCLGVASAADLGGVGGPVSGRGPLPGDRDADVDAEHAGQQGGGEFGGELEQGC
jgi:hypothetical protein